MRRFDLSRGVEGQMKTYQAEAVSATAWRRATLFTIAFCLSCYGVAFGATATHPGVKNPVARKLADDGLKAFNSGSKRVGLDLLRKAVDAAPADGCAQYLLGRALLISGDAKSAESHFRLARDRKLPDEVVLPSLFDAMLAQHKEVILLSTFVAPDTNAKGPIPASILYGRAMAMLSLGRLEQAAGSMDRAILLDRSTRSLLGRAAI